MSFETLVAHFQLGPQHTLVARVMQSNVCLPLIQETLHMDTLTLYQIIKDFIRLGVCYCATDPNFLIINVPQILEVATKLTPPLPFAISKATLIPNKDILSNPDWKPKLNRTRSMRPKCPLLRNGLRAHKMRGKNKQL
jgi:hypothetical protein